MRSDTHAFGVKLLAVIWLLAAGSSGIANPGHEKISRIGYSDRNAGFTRLVNSSGKSCDLVIRNFFQALDLSGHAHWNVGCKDGRTYGVTVLNDSREASRVIDCADLRAMSHGTTECFKNLGIVDARSLANITASDRRIIPGVRIGSVVLASQIADVEKLFGQGHRQVPGLWSGSIARSWEELGLWIILSPTTGNILWISVEEGKSKSWSTHATSEGIRLGAREEDIISAYGAPEETVQRSLFYYRRGIAFMIADSGSHAGRVTKVRISSPSIPPGDTLIVPGERISGVNVGIPIKDAIAILGPGYVSGALAGSSVKRGVTVHYWPHLSLSVIEDSGRVGAIRAGLEGPTGDCVNGSTINYSTTTGLGIGSTAADIRRSYGEPEFTRHEDGLDWWGYRLVKLVFALNKNARVCRVDVY